MKNNILSNNISCLTVCPFSSYLSDCPFGNLKNEKELISTVMNYLDAEARFHSDYVHHQQCSLKRKNS